MSPISNGSLRRSLPTSSLVRQLVTARRLCADLCLNPRSRGSVVEETAAGGTDLKQGRDIQCVQGETIGQHEEFSFKHNEKPPALRIAFDNSFDPVLTDLEVRRKWMHTDRSMTLARRSLKTRYPMALHLTGCSEDKPRLVPKKHRRYVSSTSKKPWEIFPRDKLVFLSPDSDNILEKVEEDKVYIIGGIVDLNLECRLTWNVAEENGILHARLPLQEYVKLCTDTVLTMDEVCQLLLSQLQTGDWTDTLHKHLHSRRRVKLLQAPAAVGEEPEGR